jgi:hypothetical protein
MKTFQSRWAFICVLMAVMMLATACGDDDPTGPATPANVDGVWEFQGVLSLNTCEFEAAQTISGSATFNQNGTEVSTPRLGLNVIEGIEMTFVYYGTVTGNAVSMAAVDPYVAQDGDIVIHYGSGIEVQDIEDDSDGVGSLNITGACIQGCTGSCQTVWSGTWTKR